MSYRIAGIDVHKKMLAVVVANVEVESEFQFERRIFGGNPEQLRLLAAWLLEQEAEEVVMESTAQYWHNEAIGVIAHRHCRLIWLILHQATPYEERGPAVIQQSKYKRTWRMIRQLRQLGYRIESPILNPAKHRRSDFRPW
jgi:hypothetical protein